MFWQRFYDLCVGIGSKPNPVGKQLEIASSTITQWKKGSSPSGDSLLKLSDFFGVSTDYLLGRTAAPDMENSGMTADEQALLSYFNSLNDEGKEKALERLEEMAALDRYKKGSQSGMAEEA